MSEESYFEKLVGEGKKFKDPEELAKGKYEADQFIEHLKQQNAELREELNRASKIEEVLATLQKKGDAPANVPHDGEGSEGENEGGKGETGNTSSEALTEERIRSLLDSLLQERQTQEERRKNMEQVQEALKESFGEKVGEVLESRVSELGFASLKEMEDFVSRNPRAFLRLMGIEGSKKPSEPAIPNSSVRSEALESVGKQQRRNFAYYQELRRKNKLLYFSPEIQQQMFKDRLEQGDSFYQ